MNMVLNVSQGDRKVTKATLANIQDGVLEKDYFDNYFIFY